MTIRGGGNPHTAMAEMPLGEWTRRLGALPTDAYDCFMVGTPYGFNRIQAWSARLIAANGGLPSDHARPTTRALPACRRARVRQGQAFGGAEEAPSLTAAARDGDGTTRSGRKNARGAGQTKEWNDKTTKKSCDAPLKKKAPYKPYAGKPHVRFCAGGVR